MKKRENQHIISTFQCAQKILRSLFFSIIQILRTFFRAKTLSFVVSFFLLKDKNHHASGDFFFFVDDDAKE